MRCMIRTHLDTGATNEAFKDGRMPGILKDLMGKLNPECAYFGLSEGVRSWFIVCDLDDPSQFPALFEDLFVDLHAEIEITPVMNQEDLMKGFSRLKSGQR
ncbi:DUF3303 family protein [Streptomyces sp. NPDC093225]|uniref:DUF3303 family protein n=1 Tax=Streptomyces sp. NPDC093225 TaxID=3366034 RepID=UPI0037FD3D1E